MAMYDEDGDGKLSPVELQIAVEALVQVLFSFDNSVEIFGADVSISERGVSSGAQAWFAAACTITIAGGTCMHACPPLAPIDPCRKPCVTLCTRSPAAWRGTSLAKSWRRGWRAST